MIGSSIQLLGIFYVLLRKELDEKDVLSSFQLYVQETLITKEVMPLPKPFLVKDLEVHILFRYGRYHIISEVKEYTDK